MSDNTTDKPSGGTPDLTPSSVVFAEASDRQRIICWRHNGASWAPPLTVDQYIGREDALRNTPLSRDGGTRYYVLHHRDDPDTIVSACEVTSKQALVADDGGTRTVSAYGLASVFTAPQFRGRGLATRLLREVQRAVDEQGSEFGALYSDIGRTFYTDLGWKDCRSPQLKFSPQPGFRPRPPDVENVRFLASDEVARLCDRDEAALRARLARNRKDTGATHIAFLPSHAQVSWHFTRDAYVANVMLPGRGREIRNRGAITADGASWMYWDHDIREKKLKVLRVVTDSEDEPGKRVDDVGHLLQAALAEMHDWALPALLVWSPDEAVAEAAAAVWRLHDGGEHLQLLFDERQDGSIPSLRWKGGKALDGVVWEENQYYAWC